MTDQVSFLRAALSMVERSMDSEVVSAFLDELRSVLSQGRLERYRPPAGSDLEMIVTYYWNVELCEALYQTLGALEMAFRNTIDTTLARAFNRPDWYDEPHFLQKREATGVFTTKFDLEREGKQLVPGRIVAGQTFGFWTSMISSGYKIWSDKNHALIRQAFRYAPSDMQYRKRVHEHMNTIRLFRNCVFHYESILDGVRRQNGSRTELIDVHSGIIDAIGWVNPVFQAATVSFDRFPTIYASGTEAIEARIRSHLGVL